VESGDHSLKKEDASLFFFIKNFRYFLEIFTNIRGKKDFHF